MKINETEFSVESLVPERPRVYANPEGHVRVHEITRCLWMSFYDRTGEKPELGPLSLGRIRLGRWVHQGLSPKESVFKREGIVGHIDFMGRHYLVEIKTTQRPPKTKEEISNVWWRQVRYYMAFSGKMLAYLVVVSLRTGDVKVFRFEAESKAELKEIRDEAKKRARVLKNAVQSDNPEFYLENCANPQECSYCDFWELCRSPQKRFTNNHKRPKNAKSLNTPNSTNSVDQNA